MFIGINCFHNFRKNNGTYKFREDPAAVNPIPEERAMNFPDNRKVSFGINSIFSAEVSRELNMRNKMFLCSHFCLQLFSAQWKFIRSKIKIITIN